MTPRIYSGARCAIDDSAFAADNVYCAVPILVAHSFLTHPGKALDPQPQIGGTSIRGGSRMFTMLEDLYARTEQECDIDISFNPAPSGKQGNAVLSLFLSYLDEHAIGDGRKIAERLQSMTTNRSGLGLLFLVAGREGTRHRLVVSRFPADSGVLADMNGASLTVEFVEKVFMKNAASYKAALFQGASLSADFWTGKAVDKQHGRGPTESSHYWIREFLDSDFRTTSAAGTKRLAVALREAVSRASSIAVKEELTAAVRLSRGLKGNSTSPEEFCKRFGLSDEATDLIRTVLVQPHLFKEKFAFDGDEFVRHIAYETMELDNGALLSAPAQKFDQVFTRTVEGQVERFSTTGKVIDQKLKTGR